MGNILYLVIPCYNEEEVLRDSAAKLQPKMEQMIRAGKIAENSRIIFVNDGSKDSTWSIIQALHEENKLYGGINLSRNRGHQNALLGGLMTVMEDADMTISLDADLQDDIDVLGRMVDEYHKGSDIVYGVRSSRKTDSFFKRTTAQSFYKLTNSLGGEVVYNHADFRLMSRRALQGLAEFEEVNLFLRGLVPLIGYPSSVVEYERKERLAGESKYPLKKMLALALEGITSLSVKPVRMVAGLGLGVCLLSFLMLLYVLISYFGGHSVPGWASLLVSVWFLGGLQLLAIGVVGEYVGKVYLETKKRPRYIVERYVNEKE